MTARGSNLSLFGELLKIKELPSVIQTLEPGKPWLKEGGTSEYLLRYQLGHGMTPCPDLLATSIVATFPSFAHFTAPSHQPNHRPANSESFFDTPNDTQHTHLLALVAIVFPRVLAPFPVG